MTERDDILKHDTNVIMRNAIIALIIIAVTGNIYLSSFTGTELSDLFNMIFNNRVMLICIFPLLAIIMSVGVFQINDYTRICIIKYNSKLSWFVYKIFELFSLSLILVIELIVINSTNGLFIGLGTRDLFSGLVFSIEKLFLYFFGIYSIMLCVFSITINALISYLTVIFVSLIFDSIYRDRLIQLYYITFAGNFRSELIGSDHLKLANVLYWLLIICICCIVGYFIFKHRDISKRGQKHE